MSNEYTIGCLSLFNVSAVATHIPITNIDFPTNAQVSDDGSGSLYAEHQSITGFSPVATITTKALQQLLSFIGLNGQCVGTGLPVTKADVVYRRMENCDSTLSGTPHLRDRCTKGLLRLGTINAPRGQDLTVTAMLDTLADGANAPVARTDGVALPTGMIPERHTLGVCAFAGTAFPKLEGVSLDFQVAIDEKLPAEASIWAESVGVLTVRPMLTFGTRAINQITNALMAVGAATALHSNTILQFVKRKNAGAFEDFNDPVHTRITLGGLIVPDNLASVAAAAKAVGSLRLPCSFDGTNAPVIISTTSTYDPTP